MRPPRLHAVHEVPSEHPDARTDDSEPEMPAIPPNRPPGATAFGSRPWLADIDRSIEASEARQRVQRAAEIQPIVAKIDILLAKQQQGIDEAHAYRARREMREAEERAERQRRREEESAELDLDTKRIRIRALEAKTSAIDPRIDGAHRRRMAWLKILVPAAAPLLIALGAVAQSQCSHGRAASADPPAASAAHH